MSTATAPAPTERFRPGLIARSIAVFSGATGLAIKVAILAITNAIAVWAAVVLVDRSRWVALAIL